MAGDYKTWHAEQVEAGGGVTLLAQAGHLVLAIDDEGVKAFSRLPHDRKQELKEVEVTFQVRKHTAHNRPTALPCCRTSIWA